MNPTVTDDHLHDLVARTYAEGIDDLAAAALIEHHGRFLLSPSPRTPTPPHRPGNCPPAGSSPVKPF